MTYFDRFDIVEAHYLYNSGHYIGMGSSEYRKMCHMQSYFKPRLGFGDPENLTENGQAIYAALVEKNKC